MMLHTRRASLLRDTLSNLRDVTTIMWRNVAQLMVRGETTVDLDQMSADLLYSSETFVKRTVPWYKRWFTYFEYYACYCCTRERMRRPRTRRISV